MLPLLAAGYPLDPRRRESNNQNGSVNRLQIAMASPLHTKTPWDEKCWYILKNHRTKFNL